jgi:hypothetical protein
MLLVIVPAPAGPKMEAERSEVATELEVSGRLARRGAAYTAHNFLCYNILCYNIESGVVVCLAVCCHDNRPC